MTTDRVINIDALNYSSGDAFANGESGETHLLSSGNLKATLLRFKKGQVVPMHSHSENAKILMLSGESNIEYSDGQKFNLQPGVMYVCSIMNNYKHEFVKDSIMLAIQKPGDEMIPG